MLIPTILAFLGVSVLSNEGEDENYYTIFEWNDGMKIQRRCISSVANRVGVRYPDVSVFKCGDQLFFLEKSGNLFFCVVLNTPDIKDSNKKRIVQCICWLTFEYLHDDIDNFDFSNCDYLPSGYVEARSAAGLAPDHAVPYELTVYQTGQMSKSLFMLSQGDFLKTIGKN